MRDRREPADVGRAARLELVFAARRGRTVIADAYAEPPLRVGRVFPEGDRLHMILASSSPGIFGGDRFEQVIRIERGARVRLTSQSALQVHPSTESAPACLSTTYHVAEAATLHCHWDATIPFAAARLEQQIHVQLAEGALLYWSDALMAGRASSRTSRDGRPGNVIGERWSFSSLAHEFRVTRGECLEYLERYRIVPAAQNLTDRWIGGDASYFGTTLVSGTSIAAEDVERLQEELNSAGGLQAAVDRLGSHLVVSRLMAPTGVPFHAARERLRHAMEVG